MDDKQIESALTRLFVEEGHRLVFWNDPEREFEETLADNSLPEGVEILHLDEIGALEAKVRIERDDPEGRYLLYSHTEEPEYGADWLLDVRLYSRSFRADRASIILDQLGLANRHLRDHLAVRRKFFDNKQRLQKLQTVAAPDDTDIDLDRKMIAVVTKADQPEWFDIVRTLFHAFSATENGDRIDLDTPPDAWLQVERFELDEPFWQMAKSRFGYEDETPCLRNFLYRLMATDLAHGLKGDVPSPSSTWFCPAQAGTTP